jgi:energy-coupling factor transport system substrate-specific component
MYKIINNYTIAEIVFICVMSVVMALSWSAYTFLYNFIGPFLKLTGLNGLITGVWLMGGVFFPYIIRKPGSAIIGGTLAALIEGFISQWGISAIFYGFMQSLPAEFVFLFTKYEKFKYKTICLAGLFSGFFGSIITIFIYQYYKFGILYCIVYFLSSGISGIILGGILSKILADKMYQAGVLNQYKISFDKNS